MEEQAAVQCSLHECQDELRRYLISFAVTLNDLYGSHAFRAVMGESGSVASDDEIMETTDLNRFHLSRHLPDAYDYAFAGKSSNYMGVAQADSYFELLGDFLTIAGSGNALVEVVLADYFPGTSSGCLYRLVAMGGARAILDGGGRLDAKDLSLLAGISERSVQNAFSLKGKGGLKTVRLGNLSYVEADEALRWLSDKKGFVPTAMIEFKPEADALPPSLTSQAELRAFLVSRVLRLRNEQGQQANGSLASTTLGEALGISAGVAEDKLYYGTKPILLEDACQFAGKLNIDKRWLIEQVLRLTYPEEAKVLFDA